MYIRYYTEAVYSHMWLYGWQCCETSRLLTTSVLVQVGWASDNKPMCLSWVTDIPTSICHSWLDDHRKYAGSGSVTVWGISGCGKTMGLLSLAYVHILVVNNQAVPCTVHSIIQNYRCRIKRKICLTVSFHNCDCKDIWKCPWC